MAERDRDREIESVQHTLEQQGALDEDQLEQAVRGEGWGPGRFQGALREAVEEGRAERLSRRRFGPARHDGNGRVRQDAPARG
jgi:hypothetical protein